MNILRSYLLKIKKRKYISLRQSIIFQYLFLFSILLRPLPVLEDVENINVAFLQIIYLLLPEITYYLLIIYSLIKVFKLKSYLSNKIISYVLVAPNFLFSLKLTSYTVTNICILFKYCLNLKYI